MRDHEGLIFPLSEYERRIEELRRRMVERELDVVLISDPENLCYLTGFHTTGYSFFQVLGVPLDKEPFMVTRLLEHTNIAPRTWVELSRPFPDTGDAIQTTWRALEEFGLAHKRIGIERNSYFFPAYQQARFDAMLYDVDVRDCYGIVEDGRQTKSDVEIELMRKAGKATEAGMKAGIEATRAGATENDVAAAIHHAMYSAGGEYPAVAPYVTSGPRVLLGHGTWEGRTIENDECVFLEIAGCRSRYHTAMMRTIWVGDEIPSEMRAAEHAVKAALDAMMRAMRPGYTIAEVDRVAREALEEYHGTGSLITRSGYSIGIAFAPSWDEGYILSLMPGEQRYLQRNMTFHIIPWLYGVSGKHVLGLSETVRVTEDGGESLIDGPARALAQVAGG